MTNAAIQKELTAMKADIRELKKSVKVNAIVERARAQLRAKILKGINSGAGKPVDAAYWKRLHVLARTHAKSA